MGATWVPGAGGDPGTVVLASSQLTVVVSPLGATLRRVLAPDAAGAVGDVLLHLDREADWADPARNPYLGAVVGRWANRIAGARFPAARLGRGAGDVELAPNEGPNLLHGGPDGVDRRRWDVVEVLGAPDDGAVTLALRSPDGDQGFPGALEVTVTHALASDELHTTITATSDAPTVVNLCPHPYWRLDDGPTVADHELTVDAERVLPVDDALLPTGPPVPVAGTPFDVRAPQRLGDVVAALGRGLDECFVVAPAGERRAPGDLRRVVLLRAPRSGRWLEVRSDQPGVQVYSGAGLAPPHVPHGGVAVEPQRLPDAPNQPGWPAPWSDAVLRPGERYRSTTVHRLGTGEPPRP